MSQGFVPLPAVPSPNGADTFRLEVIPGTAAAEFTAWTKTPPAETARAEHEVAVELQHEGDRVSGARIRCACGRAIDLAFTL